MRDFGEEWLNRDMANTPKEADPNKAAFLAALEKKIFWPNSSTN
jgi:hypothetical protein